MPITVITLEGRTHARSRTHARMHACTRARESPSSAVRSQAHPGSSPPAPSPPGSMGRWGRGPGPQAYKENLLLHAVSFVVKIPLWETSDGRPCSRPFSLHMQISRRIFYQEITQYCPAIPSLTHGGCFPISTCRSTTFLIDCIIFHCLEVLFCIILLNAFLCVGALAGLLQITLWQTFS